MGLVFVLLILPHGDFFAVITPAFVSPKATYFFWSCPKKVCKKMRVRGCAPDDPLECRDCFRRGVRWGQGVLGEVGSVGFTKGSFGKGALVLRTQAIALCRGDRPRSPVDYRGGHWLSVVVAYPDVRYKTRGDRGGRPYKEYGESRKVKRMRL